MATQQQRSWQQLYPIYPHSFYILCLRLSAVCFPTTHHYVVAMHRESSAPWSRRLASLVILLSNRAKIFVVYDRPHELLVRTGTTGLQRLDISSTHARRKSERVLDLAKQLNL